jgi:sugar lactone lactonase YvrE
MRKRKQTLRLKHIAIACFATMTLAACGGGGDGGNVIVSPQKSVQSGTVVAEWNRLSYDLGDAAAEKAYEDNQVYKKVLMQGVKVDSTGTMYVSTARWNGPEVPATLSKLVQKDGKWKLQPFPNKELNRIDNPMGLKAVLGFEIDRNDVMWILDQGHVAGAPNAPGDAKLIAWDLKTNKEVQRYAFSDVEADPKCSFLNDVVVDNDTGFVYITDSGIFCDPLKGGLIVYDANAKKARRILTADPYTNDEAYTFQIHGRNVTKSGPMRTGADGIALSGDKRTLYWSNLTGNRLLSLPANLLRDFSTPEATIRSAVKVEKTLPSNMDGMTSDRDNNLIMTALSLNGLTLWDRDSNEVKPYYINDDVSWADTVAWGPNGSLYFVSNHLHLFVDNDMNFDNPAVPNFRIYKIETGRKPYTAP